MSEEIEKSGQEFEKDLTPEEYHILREKGTERAFTGKYNDHKDDGMYHCRACGAPVFDSIAKYSSGSGWPSFYQPVDGKVTEITLGNEAGDLSRIAVPNPLCLLMCFPTIPRF